MLYFRDDLFLYIPKYGNYIPRYVLRVFMPLSYLLYYTLVNLPWVRSAFFRTGRFISTYASNTPMDILVWKKF